MCLIIKPRILDVIITLQSLRIETPLCIHVDLGITELGLLGSDHDDTIGTTRSVKGVRCSILEHCHRLDISRVEVVHITGIRYTVHHVKRSSTRCDGTDTTDHD